MTNTLTKEKVIKMKNIANELKGDAKYCGENIFAGTLNQKNYLLKSILKSVQWYTPGLQDLSA